MRSALQLATTIVVFATALLAQPPAPRVPGPGAPTIPPPLHHEAVAFDEARGRLVVVGGVVPGGPGERPRPGGVWEWDGHRWTVPSPGPSGPGARYAAGVGYDPVARRVVVYGGRRDTAPDAPEVPLCDTWFYDGRAWTRADAARCVTTRGFSNVIHDAARGTLLLVEGPPDAREAPRPLRLWRWDGADWVLADSSGPRWQEAEVAAYDRARSVLVVPVMAGPDVGVWEWDGRRWRHVPSTAPTGRGFFGLAYDAGRRRVVLAGGRTHAQTPGGRRRVLYQDVWAWDGTRWREVPVAGDPRPSPRGWARLVANPATGGLLYFGGVDSAGISRELWELDRGGTWHRRSPR